MTDNRDKPEQSAYIIGGRYGAVDNAEEDGKNSGQIQAGQKVVAEYEVDKLAVDSDDEKKLDRAERKEVKKYKR